ncbi:hypothetical protein J6590_106936, partial [Homalodisca vitripennis]
MVKVVTTTSAKLGLRIGGMQNLSEPPCCGVLLDFPLAFSDIVPHQLKDPELTAIINELKNGGAHPPYFLYRGALCCRDKQRRKPKLVLPSFLVPM